MISEFFLALESSQPFKLAYKRAVHLKNGHPYDSREYIEKHSYEKHPHSDDKYVFVCSMYKCTDCGLIGFDKDLESHKFAKGEE